MDSLCLVTGYPGSMTWAVIISTLIAEAPFVPQFRRATQIRLAFGTCEITPFSGNVSIWWRISWGAGLNSLLQVVCTFDPHVPVHRSFCAANKAPCLGHRMTFECIMHEPKEMAWAWGSVHAPLFMKYVCFRLRSNPKAENQGHLSLPEHLEDERMD